MHHVLTSGLPGNMTAADVLQKVLLIAVVQQAACTGFSFTVREEMEEGIKVGTLCGVSQPPYQLLGQTYVRVDEHSGDLYTTENTIDREELCPAQQDDQCTIKLTALVGLENEILEVTFIVEDINDNAPYFQDHMIRLSVPEDTAIGTSFFLDDKAQDLDMGVNGEIGYSLVGSSGCFSVKDGEQSLVVVLLDTLDRESQDTHLMTLIATDRGSRPLSGTAMLKVTVTDVNDNCPEFDTDGPHAVEIKGDTPKGTVVAQVKAIDVDQGDNAEVSYSFSQRNSERSMALFHVSGHDGLITLAGSLLTDRPQEYVLNVLASGPLCYPVTTEVRVSVQPVTSPEPTIKIGFIAEHQNQTILLPENKHPAALALLELWDSGNVSRVLVIEGDVPFSLKAQSHSGTYLLTTSASLDFEACREYHISVAVRSAQGERLDRRRVIRVEVVDVNDNPPLFNQTRYQISVEENNAPGTVLIQLSATDRDSQKNGRVFYSLSGNAPSIFRVDRVTGHLSALDSLDREHVEFYVLTVLAQDGGSPPLKSSALVHIHVLDRNDSPPTFLTPHFIFFVVENIPRLAVVGKVGVTDADSGDNGRLEVRVLNGSGPFVMDNALRLLRCTEMLDREDHDRYDLLMLAIDCGSPALSSTARVTVFVEDVNDNQPQVIMPTSNFSCLIVSPATPEGTMVTRIYAVDKDVGINADLSYHLAGSEPPRHSPFQIDKRSGNISLVKRLVGPDHGMHHLLAVVSDGGKPVSLQTLVWVNLLVNQTKAACLLSGIPANLPRQLPRPTVPVPHASSQSCVPTPKTVLLMGLGALVCALCLLMVAVVLFVKQKHMKKSLRKRNECVPLKEK
ncbi:protocadherin-20 [Denticeps clupeoides]|uniref:Cadherin domain-containing protein n=1 Tax=Denticeps clupeoides TaxID=299321 RepID=A0AAY4CYP5_9TELE|nr:protocadherin-20-like [Denticeps clupeoides]